MRLKRDNLPSRLKSIFSDSPMWVETERDYPAWKLSAACLKSRNVPTSAAGWDPAGSKVCWWSSLWLQLWFTWAPYKQSFTPTQRGCREPSTTTPSGVREWSAGWTGWKKTSAGWVSTPLSNLSWFKQLF